MPFKGTGVLFACTDIPASIEEEFKDWYNREHVPERVGITGFNRGRRYAALEGSPKYIALYETDTPEVFTTEEYISFIESPDANARHYIPQFVGVTRTIGRVNASVGADSEGGLAGFVTFKPQAGKEDGLRDWLIGEAVPQLATQHGILGAHFFEKDPAALEASQRRHYRKGGGGELDWVIGIEGTDAPDIEAAAKALLSENALTDHGAEPGATFKVYRLLMSLSR